MPHSPSRRLDRRAHGPWPSLKEADGVFIDTAPQAGSHLADRAVHGLADQVGEMGIGWRLGEFLRSRPIHLSPARPASPWSWVFNAHRQPDRRRNKRLPLGWSAIWWLECRLGNGCLAPALSLGRAALRCFQCPGGISFAIAWRHPALRPAALADGPRSVGRGDAFDRSPGPITPRSGVRHRPF